MRLTAAKTVSALAIAGVAVLGAQYAGAVPGHAGSAAQPNTAPIRNIAHLFSAPNGSGTDDVLYNVPALSAGIYSASISANFFPAGTPAAPETFSCYILKNGQMRAQSTASSTYSSGFYVGVNATNMVKISSGDALVVGCGTADGSNWDYGTRPLQVTFTKLDGLKVKTLTETKQQLQQSSPTTH